MAEYIDKERLLSDLYSKQDDENLDVMLEIANFPAADVAPVVHGRWIFGDTMGRSWMKCSKCLKAQSGQTACFSYCPNCGATIDGGDEDADD